MEKLQGRERGCSLRLQDGGREPTHSKELNSLFLGRLTTTIIQAYFMDSESIDNGKIIADSASGYKAPLSRSMTKLNAEAKRLERCTREEEVFAPLLLGKKL
jgi:hypothetical protein